jgi:hypothetical protein
MMRKEGYTTPTGGHYDRTTRMTIERRIERAYTKGTGLTLTAEDVQRFKAALTDVTVYNQAGKRGMR